MAEPTDELPRLFLQSGHDRRVAEGCPWAYSNEIRIDAAAKALPAGSLATLHRVDGKPFGIGTFNPHALIAFRLFDRDIRTRLDADFFAARLVRALALRQRLFDQPFYRLVHAEADGLPGLVCDRFGEVIVLQLGSAGIEKLFPALLGAIEHVLAPRAIVLRNDHRARSMEGLPFEVMVCKGEISGPVEVSEGRNAFFADVLSGQKTGWFFDQRDSRAAVAPLAADGTMLDVYCHTGGFAIAAATAGAEQVLAIDSSETALTLARAAAAANGVADRLVVQRLDGFDALVQLAAAGERFQVVAADPPAFVKSRRELASGLKGYRKLARLAAAVVAPGGFLFIASCSHNVDPASFLDEVTKGIGAAGRNGRILRQAGASADHPVHLHLPESAYLKSLLLQLD